MLRTECKAPAGTRISSPMAGRRISPSTSSTAPSRTLTSSSVACVKSSQHWPGGSTHTSQLNPRAPNQRRFHPDSPDTSLCSSTHPGLAQPQQPREPPANHTGRIGMALGLVEKLCPNGYLSVIVRVARSGQNSHRRSIATSCSRNAAGSSRSLLRLKISENRHDPKISTPVTRNSRHGLGTS